MLSNLTNITSITDKNSTLSWVSLKFVSSVDISRGKYRLFISISDCRLEESWRPLHHDERTN